MPVNSGRTRNRLYNSGIYAFDAVQQVCGAPVLEPLLVQEEEPIGRDQGIRKRQSCPIYHRLFGYEEGQGRFFRVEVHAVEHHRRQGYWVEEEVSGTVPELFIDVNRIDNAYYLDIEPTRVPDRRRHYDRVPHLEVEYEGRPSAYSGFHHEALRPCADNVLRRRAFEIVDVIIQVRDAVEVPARD